ncbi:MAG: hypothetical protein U5L09_20675 [Bacteroidales bacterium]|nr:hypothetical protein [Bacteroidales bacterium]
MLMIIMRWAHPIHRGNALMMLAKIKEAASRRKPARPLPEASLNVFLTPTILKLLKKLKSKGFRKISWKQQNNPPVYKMAIDWRVSVSVASLKYRTITYGLVCYTSLSPIQSAADSGKIGHNGILPDVDSLRIPNKYMANMFTAGDEKPIKQALKKMLAMRAYMRTKTVEQKANAEVLNKVDLTVEQVEEMYRYMAIANYEDRFVIPASHKEYAEDAFGDKAACGFTDGDGCGTGKFKNLFGGI